MKIRYEDMIDDPKKTLETISHHTGIQFNSVIEKIKKNQPLRRGYIFNGNRMRMSNDIRLKSKNRIFPKSLKNKFIVLINGFWY